MVTISVSAFVCAAVFFPSVRPQVATGQTEVHYTVRAHDAMGSDKRIPVSVSMRIVNPPRRAVLELPVWTPGSYRLRDFPDRVSNVLATDAHSDREPLAVERLHRHRWQVKPRSNELTLSYSIELRENDRFMLRGKRRRCITYEGPAMYMYLRDHKDAPCYVEFDIPDDWDVGCGLDPLGGRRYFAADYDFLADCPVKLGTFQRFTFESHGKPIDVVVDGPGDLEFDSETWVANIKKITDCQGAIFGGFPFDKYTFLYTASPVGGGGGLEHLTSTAIGLRASQLRTSPETGMGVTAHEFIHLWNVKRMRPRELGPFDYTRPNRTTALWIMEGFTSYYAQVTLARCGLISEDAFWNSMRRQIASFENNPAREHVSSADASHTVWESKPSDRNVNYYNSGLVLGLLLDIEIRAASNNTRSLDELMRLAFRYCELTGRGFEEREFVELTSTTAGADLGEFFDRYATGTCSPDYESVLAKAGVEATVTTSRSKSLRGARPGPRSDGVLFVDPDARDQRAVLRNSGTVRKLDGAPVETLEDIEAAIQALDDGTEVRIVIEGTYGERTLPAEVVTAPKFRIRLSLDDRVDPAALAIREGIITGVPRCPGR